MTRKNSGMATNRMMRPRRTPTSCSGRRCERHHVRAGLQDAKEQRGEDGPDRVVAGEDRDGDPVETVARNPSLELSEGHHHEYGPADTAQCARQREREQDGWVDSDATVLAAAGWYRRSAGHCQGRVFERCDAADERECYQECEQREVRPRVKPVRGD